MKTVIIFYVLFLSCIFILLFQSCATLSDEVDDAEITVESFPKIDFHTHYSYSRENLIELFDTWNMKAVIIDVARGVEEPERDRWNAMKKHYNQHPDYLFLCTAFDAHNINDSDYVQKIIEQLEKDIRDGARLVKVWKSVGMSIKEADGKYIQIDDIRFQPIWDYLVENDIPVIAHIADPVSGWLPYDENLAHSRYFRNNPQYYPFLNPEIPGYEEIIQARDNWIESNPDLIIIGAHLGSLSHDVELVADRLDRFDNLYVDLSARFGDLALQPSDTVRDFFITYKDRIVYGTDMGTRLPEAELGESGLESESASRHRILNEHWNYLTGTDSLLFDSPMFSFPVPTQGLNLPLPVLKKIYYENARILLKIDN